MAPGRSKVIPFELEHWILDSLNRFSFFGWLSKQIDYQTSVRVTLSMMQVLELNQCWEISDRCANNFFFFTGFKWKRMFSILLKWQSFWYISFHLVRAVLYIYILFVFLLFLIIFNSNFSALQQADGMRHCMPDVYGIAWINRRNCRPFFTSPAVHIYVQ